jgi:hypothetical protein
LIGVFICRKESRVRRAIILYLLFFIFIYRKVLSSKRYNITFFYVYIEKIGERKRIRTEPTIKNRKEIVGGQPAFPWLVERVVHGHGNPLGWVVRGVFYDRNT